MEIEPQVKEEIQMAERTSETKSRIRELMAIVIASDLTVEEVSIVQEGDVSSGYVEFSIPIESTGLTGDTMKRFKREIFTSMFIDFVAELAIRENLEAFLKEMSHIKLVDYTNVIGNRRHGNAGMCIKGNSMVFTFHLSLLQDILVSDFKKKA